MFAVKFYHAYTHKHTHTHTHTHKWWVGGWSIAAPPPLCFVYAVLPVGASAPVLVETDCGRGNCAQALRQPDCHWHAISRALKQ